ncbi:MAG: hypothetical protein EZS28_000352 [Streblomastix strix]|uniref:Uncharacterized protein n=1 Tax=Streblomastix strix TaxID=222440 RepID=A0A5J4XAE7_9EUKA|nr:MAG: hypothetical protein EZS28_000352 [Streblomastix strix]
MSKWKCKEELREVRKLSQESLDRGAGKLEQPMGLQISAPNILVQSRSLAAVTIIFDQHAKEETKSVFTAQRANIKHQNNGNEMNIPQQAHLAAQRADGPGFQPLIYQGQEQSEVDTEQDQGQLDLNTLSDKPENESPPGLTQETETSRANKAASNHTLNHPVRKRSQMTEQTSTLNCTC